MVSLNTLQLTLRRAALRLATEFARVQGTAAIPPIIDTDTQRYFPIECYSTLGQKGN